MISQAERRRYIADRLHADWGWIKWEKGPEGASTRDIVRYLERAHDGHRFNPMTIKRDIDTMREAASMPTQDELSEARQLLKPENFPEWRAKFFKVPGANGGQPFQTPKFQHAIFWVMHAATFKIELPEWVIEYLDELDPKHPFPDDINKIITGEKKTFLSFLLLMAPRHGKTELMVHFVLHTFAMDPNKRIMFGNGTQKKSEGFIDNAIMSTMEGLDPLSEEFVEMYGPFRDDNRAWSKMGFTLAGRQIMNKMFSMQPFGISGNIRSFDADSILGDDLADLARSRSETTTDFDYDWLTTELMMRREYSTSLILTGSHVAVSTGDLFTRLLNNLEKLNVGRSRFIVKAIPAHFYEQCDPINDPKHEKCVLWPEGERDYGFLEAKRAELDDDAMFEAVFNQIPQTAAMQHFPPSILRAPYQHYEMIDGRYPVPGKNDDKGILDSLRSWQDHPVCCGGDTILAMGFDPAASEKKGASFSALIVKAACPRCGRRYAVDYWKDRQSPEVHPSTIASYANAYPHLAMVNIEINAYQKSLSRDPRMEQLEAASRFIIKEWNTDERKHDPALGVPAMARHLKSGMYSVPYRTSGDQEFAETLIKEYTRWPQKPNDLVMADWLADLALEELLEDYRYVGAELIDGSDRFRTEQHDELTYEVNMDDIVDDHWEYA